MKKAISKSDFRDAFIGCGRKEQFSYDGLGELYDWLEESYDDYELDVVGLCCEFAEDEIANVLKEYDLESLEELVEKTIVVWNDDTNVLYVQF